jgi:hypothetical protein
MNELQVGDVVKHVAGGPEMKVSKFGTQNSGNQYFKLGGSTVQPEIIEDKSNVYCTWWDTKKNEAKYQWFPSSDLIKVNGGASNSGPLGIYMG